MPQLKNTSLPDYLRRDGKSNLGTLSIIVGDHKKGGKGWEFSLI